MASEVTTLHDAVAPEPGRVRRAPRLFATPADEPRARRATDAIVLAGGMVLLAILTVLEEPSPALADAVARLFAALPDLLRALWEVVADLLTVAAVVVLVASAVRRRWTLVRDILLAAVVALAVSYVLARITGRTWPDGYDALRSAAPPPWYPSFRLAVPGAMVMTASPHLTLPVRRLGRWLVGLTVLGAIALGATAPMGAAAGLVVAATAASAIHLVFGSSGGRPGLVEVRQALTELGVATAELGAAERQEAGVFTLRAVDRAGEPLVVKVYGRDAHDSALVTNLWRSVWLREPGTPVLLGRLQQVEHEAFLTLLAAQAGVLTDRVVTAGSTAADDAVLVLRRTGRPLGPADGDALPRLWEALRLLHGVGVVHGRLDAHHLVVDGDRAGFVDFRGGSVPATATGRRTDEVQLLVATVLLAGQDTALAAAHRALGTDELAAVLPYIQRPALAPEQRPALKAAGLDLDDLRTAAADLAGTEPPELYQLQRISLASVARVALPLVAIVALFTAATGLDTEALVDAVTSASWPYLVAAFFVAQAPRLTQAVSTLGAAPVLLPLGPVYALQLALSYISLAIPTAAGRVAINIRFFQRHGVPPGPAVAAGCWTAWPGSWSRPCSSGASCCSPGRRSTSTST